MDAAHERELERIRAAYRRRDEGSAETSGWNDPAYVLAMHGLDRAVLAGLRRAGASLEGASVLEVGCGSGAILHRLLELGAARGTGVDLMEHRVAAARERYPTLDVRQGDAAALPFPDGSFDLVTQFTCLSSVLDADLRRRIAAEMRRVTRPGGALLSYDMRPTPAPLRAVARVLAPPPPGATPVVQLGPDELARLFGGAPKALEAVTLNPALWPLARRSPALGVALRALPPLRSHLLAVFLTPS